MMRIIAIIKKCLESERELILSSIEEEDKVLPWEKKKEEIIPTDLPKYIDIVLYDRIYISKKKLHPFIKKKLIQTI